MIVLSNVKKLYTGASASESALCSGVDVVIDQGKISAISPHGMDSSLPKDTEVIDCSAYTITPGIIDCHMHITSVDFNFPKMNSQANFLYFEKNLYKTLVNAGVTSARDMGGCPDYVRRLVNEEVVLGPRLKLAVCVLSTTGGHADFRGVDRCHNQIQPLWPEAPGRPSNIVDGPEACRKRVREIIACGADLIKVCTSGGVVSLSDDLEDRGFTDEELLAMVDEAKARGRFVSAHAHSKNGIAAAIRTGVKFLEHISFLDQDLAHQAAEKQCIVTPTSWIIHLLAESPNLPPAVLSKAKQALEAHQNAVKCCLDAGLEILCGTDASMPHMHGQNYLEIVYLVRDGLTPLNAWYAATGRAAKALGDNSIGVLEKGRFADLLIYSEDVLSNPEALARGKLLEVVKEGVGYKKGLLGLPQKDFTSTLEKSLPN